MTYELVCHTSPGDFLERAESWLLAREAEHNLHLSLAYARSGVATESADRTDAADRAVGADVLFGTVEQAGVVVGCVIRTPLHKLLVTSIPSESARNIVETVAGVYDQISAVLGPADSAVAVASAWVALKGGGWETAMQQRICRLDAVVPARPVSGFMRLATMEDLESLAEWRAGFARDVGHAFLLESEQISRMIERQDLRIWQDERPVSMAVAQGGTPNACRVGYVYTPPEARGSGYASALVADLSEHMLDSGLSFCVLYTALSNPTSNAIYQRIGYEAVCEVRDINIVSRPV